MIFSECRESRNNPEKSIFFYFAKTYLFGSTYSRKNSLKFQRFIWRAKFEICIIYNGGFRGLNAQNVMLLYEDSRDVKRILWKGSLAQISFLYLKFLWTVSWSFVCSFLTKRNCTAAICVSWRGINKGQLWLVQMASGIYHLLKISTF